MTLGCFPRAKLIPFPLLRTVPLTLLRQVGFYLLCPLDIEAPLQKGSARASTACKPPYPRLLEGGLKTCYPPAVFLRGRENIWLVTRKPFILGVRLLIVRHTSKLAFFTS